jgi:hypothetical protein
MRKLEDFREISFRENENKFPRKLSRKCENENFHFNPSFMHDTDPPLEKNVRNHTQGKFKQTS